MTHANLNFIRKFKAKSTLTEEDAIKLGKDLNLKLAKRRTKTIKPEYLAKLAKLRKGKYMKFNSVDELRKSIEQR
jgi:hypothetical protein